MKSRIALTLVSVFILMFAVAAFAQSAQKTADKSAAMDNPFSTWNKGAYAHLKHILLASAEKMPEENYNFKPVDSVRTYGQILGHIADAQYMFCATALGEKNPGMKVEETKTSKADLTAALKDAFAYCDKAYDSMTDAKGAETANLFNMEMPRLDVLTINNMHNMEHYGNLVTYMRIKGIVPPTSEGGSMPAPPAKK
jgi:uncharacterized damage-inducible protein DinB